jgi:hypothetical protein
VLCRLALISLVIGISPASAQPSQEFLAGRVAATIWWGRTLDPLYRFCPPMGPYGVYDKAAFDIVMGYIKRHPEKRNLPFDHVMREVWPCRD